MDNYFHKQICTQKNADLSDIDKLINNILLLQYNPALQSEPHNDYKVLAYNFLNLGFQINFRIKIM